MAGPAPRLHRGHEPEIGTEDEVVKWSPSEIRREKQRQGNCQTEENRQWRRTRVTNKCPLIAKERTRPNQSAKAAITTDLTLECPLLSSGDKTSCDAVHGFSFDVHNVFPFILS